MTVRWVEKLRRNAIKVTAVAGVTTTSAGLSEHFSWEEPALTDGCNNQTARPLRFDRDRVIASTSDTERVGNAVGAAGPVVTAGFVPAVSPIKRID